MSGNFKTRYRRWNRWKKWNKNGPVYKFLVLIGLAYSPTFEMLPKNEEFEIENGIVYV